MGIEKRVLISLMAMAITLTTFVSSAMAAEDGIVKDANGTVIANGTTLNFKGWAKFETLGTGIECHVTATYEATGTEGKTGRVTSFSPITSTCHGFGSIYKGCKISADGTVNLPYTVTVTKTDLDVTATNIILLNNLTGCENFSLTFNDLYFEAGITLKPLSTGTRPVTNTDNKLGNTPAGGELIAGIELEALGEAVNNIGTLGVIATGELEIEGSNRCTYKLN